MTLSERKAVTKSFKNLRLITTELRDHNDLIAGEIDFNRFNKIKLIIRE